MKGLALSLILLLGGIHGLLASFLRLGLGQELSLLGQELCLFVFLVFFLAFTIFLSFLDLALFILNS